MKLSKYTVVMLLLQSCVLHPPYQQPAVEIPEQWRFTSDDTSDDLELELEQMPVPNEENDLEKQMRGVQSININRLWWDQFNDPVLTGLIDEALQSNQDIKIAIFRVEEYAARFGIAKSQLFPQIYGNAFASKQEESLGGVTPTSTITEEVSPGGDIVQTETVLPVKRITDLFGLNVTLSYEFDIWGKIFSATQSARAELYAQENVRRTVVLTVVTAVASGYIRLRELDQELQIALETDKSYTESYRLAKLRYDKGLSSELAVKQAESLISLAQAEVVRLRGLISIQENALSVLVGHPPTSIERGLTITEWPEPFGVPSGLPSELLFQRPDILQAEQQLIAANARIGVARAEYFPSISLTGLFGFESLELKNLFRDTAQTWTYGLNLLQPIFTGGLISSRVAAAEAIKYEAYYSYIQTVLNGFKEVEDALVFYRQSKELFEVENNRVKILNEYLHLATLQYSNGQTDYLSVLDAERSLFDAQLDLAKAQGDIFLALIEIYKALAGGWLDQADSRAISSCTACTN